MSSGFDTHVSRLAAQLQTLRQIRKSASAPFFDQTIEPMSRIKRICEERERLSNSGLLNLRLSFYQSDSGYGQSEEKGDVNIVSAVEDDLSNSYTDIAYMLQSDYKASQPRTHELQESQQSQTELKRHVRQQSDARLQATFKLLSESIEEAGNLRALLEYSLEPEKIDILLASVDPTKSHATSSHLSTDKENTTSPNRRYRKNSSSIDKNNMIEDADKSSVTRELKYRALLLEQGNLLDQLISVRTVLEEERQRRVRAERDLSISIDVLNSTQVECDAMQQQLHDSQELNHTLTRSLQLNSPVRRQAIESHNSSDNSLLDALDNSIIERADQDFNVNDNMDGSDSDSLALSLFDLSTTDANTDFTSTEHNTFALFDTTLAGNRENLRLPPSKSKLSRSGILGRSKNNNNNNNNQHVKNLYMQYLSEVERVEDAPPLPLDAPPTEDIDVQKDGNVDTNSSYTGASSGASSNSGRKQKTNSQSMRKADKRIDLLGSIDSASHLPNHHSSSSTSSHKMVVDSNFLEELDGDPLDSQSIEDLSTETFVIPHFVSDVLAENNAAGAITIDNEPGATKNKKVETNNDSSLRRVDLLGSLNDTSNSTSRQETEMVHTAATAITSVPSTTTADTDDPEYLSLPADLSFTDEANIGAVVRDIDTQIVLDIDIGEGRKAEVIITPTCDPVELTVQLIVLYSLPGEYFTPLLDYISQTQKKLCEDIGAGIVVAAQSGAANDKVDLVDDLVTPSVQEANELLSELDDINPSDVSEIVEIEEEETLSLKSHSLSEEDGHSSHLSQEEDENTDSLTERSPSPDSNILLALEDEFQEYLKAIGENIESEEVSQSEDAISESAGEDLGLIELDQEPTPPSSPPPPAPTTALPRSPPTVPSSSARRAKSPTSGVHFSPTMDTSEGTYMYAHYQSDSSDNGSVAAYDGDIYQEDGVESQVNTPMPNHRSPGFKQSSPSAQSVQSPRYSPRSPRSPYSPRSPGGSKYITLTLPSSLQNITVALPRNVVDLTVNIPPNVQNITVTVPKRLSGKLSVSPKSSRSSGTGKYGSRSGSSSSGNSPLQSPMGYNTNDAIDHSILVSNQTRISPNLSLVNKPSAVHSAATPAVESIAPATASSRSPPKGKSPSRPSETDVSRENRPHRKRKFFPSSLNVLSLLEAATNSADTGVDSAQENSSPLPAKIGRQGVTPTHRKNTESSAHSTHLSPDTAHDSEPTSTNASSTLSAPEGTASSFFKHALQVLEPEAMSPGRKPRVIPTAISITHESVSSEHSHQGAQLYSSVGEFCSPDAEGDHAHLDTGSTITSSGSASEEPSHSKSNTIDLVLPDAVVDNVAVLSPPRSFAAQVAQIEAHVHELLSNPGTPTGFERVVEIASVEHRTVPAPMVDVVDELWDDFDLDNDDTSSSDGSISSSTHSPSDRMLAAEERFKAELPASPARGSRLFDRRADALGSIDDLHSPAQEPYIESNTVSSLTASSALDVDVPDIVTGDNLNSGVQSPHIYMSVDDHPRMEYYDTEDSDGENDHVSGADPGFIEEGECVSVLINVEKVVSSRSTSPPMLPVPPVSESKEQSPFYDTEDSGGGDDHVPSGDPGFIMERDSVSVLIDADSAVSPRSTSPPMLPVPPVSESKEQSPLPPLPSLVETEQYEEMQYGLDDDVLQSLMIQADDGSINEDDEEYLEDFDSFDSFNEKEQSQDSPLSCDEASVAPSSQECSEDDVPAQHLHDSQASPRAVQTPSMDACSTNSYNTKPVSKDALALTQPTGVRARNVGNRRDSDLLRSAHLPKGVTIIERVSVGATDTSKHTSPSSAGTVDTTNKRFSLLQDDQLRDSLEAILGREGLEIHSSPAAAQAAKDIPVEENSSEDEECTHAYAGTQRYIDGSHTDDRELSFSRSLILGTPSSNSSYVHSTTGHTPYAMHIHDAEYQVDDEELIAGAGAWLQNEDSQQDDSFDLLALRDHLSYPELRIRSDRNFVHEDDHHSDSAPIERYDYDDADPAPVPAVIEDSDYWDREGSADNRDDDSDDHSVHIGGYYCSDRNAVPAPLVPVAVDDNEFSDREGGVDDQSDDYSDNDIVHIDSYDYDEANPEPVPPALPDGNDVSDYSDREVGDSDSASDSGSAHIDGYDYDDADPEPPQVPTMIDDSDFSDKEGVYQRNDDSNSGSGSVSVHIDGYDYVDVDPAPPVPDVIDDSDYSDRLSVGDADSDSGSVHIDGYDYDDANPDPVLPVLEEFNDSDYSDRHSEGDNECDSSSSVHIDGYDYENADPASAPAALLPVPDVIRDSDYSHRQSDVDDHCFDRSDSSSVRIDGYDYGIAHPAPPVPPVPDVIDDSDYSYRDCEDGDHSEGNSDGGSVHIDGYDYHDDADPVPLAPNVVIGSDFSGGLSYDHLDGDYSDREGNDDRNDEDSDSGSMHLNGYTYGDDADPDPEAVPHVHDAVEDSDDLDGEDHAEQSDDASASGSVHIDGYDYDDGVDPVLPVPEEVNDSDFSDGHSDDHDDSNISGLHIDGYDYDDADIALAAVPELEEFNDSDYSNRHSVGDDSIDSGSSVHMDGYDYDYDADPASQVPPVPAEFNDSDFSDRHSDYHSDDDSGSVHIEDYDYDDRVDPAPALPVPDDMEDSEYFDKKGDDVHNDSDGSSVHIDGYDNHASDSDSIVNSVHIEGYAYHDDVDPVPRGPLPAEFNDSDYSDKHSERDDDSASASVHIDGYECDDDANPDPVPPVPEEFNDSDYSDGHSDDHDDSDSDSLHIDGYDYDDVDPAPAPVSEEFNDSDFSGSYGYDNSDNGSVHIEGYEYNDEDTAPVPPVPYGIDDSDYEYRGGDADQSDVDSASGSVHIDGYDYDDADPALVSVADVIDASVYALGVDEADHCGNSGDNCGEGSVHIERYKFDNVDPALALARPLSNLINVSNYSDEEGDNSVDTDSSIVHIDGYDYDDADHAPGFKEFNDSDFSDRHSDYHSGEDSGSVHIEDNDYHDTDPALVPPVPDVIEDSEYFKKEGDNVHSDSDSGSVHIDGYNYDDAIYPVPAPVPEVIDNRDFSDSVDGNDEQSDSDNGSVHIDGYDYESTDPAPAPAALLPVPKVIHGSDEYLDGVDEAVDHSDVNSDIGSVHIDGYDYDDVDPAPAPKEFNDSDFSDRLSDDVSGSVHIDGFNYDDDADPAPPVPPVHYEINDFEIRDGEVHSDDDSDSRSVHIDGYDYDDAVPVLPPASDVIDDSDFSDQDQHSGGDEYRDNESVHIDGYAYDDADSAPAVPIPNVIDDSDYSGRDGEDGDRCDDDSDGGSVHIDGYDYDEDEDPAPAGPAGEAFDDRDYSDREGNPDYRDDGSDSNSGSVHIDGYDYDEANPEPVPPMSAVFDGSDYSDREGGDDASDSGNVHIDGYDTEEVDPEPPQVPTVIDDSDFSDKEGGYQSNDDSDSGSVRIDGYDYHDDVEPAPRGPVPKEFNDSDYSDSHSEGDDDSDNSSSVHIDGYDYNDANPAPVSVTDVIDDSDHSDGVGEADDHSDVGSDIESVHIEGYNFDVVDPALVLASPPSDVINDSDYSDGEDYNSVDTDNGSVHIDGYNYDDDTDPVPAAISIHEEFNDSDHSDRQSDYQGDNVSDSGSVHIDGYDYDDADPAPAPVSEEFNDSDFSGSYGDDNSDNGSVHIEGYEYNDEDTAPVPPVPDVIDDSDYEYRGGDADQSDVDSASGSVHIDGYDYNIVDEADPTSVPAVPEESNGDCSDGHSDDHDDSDSDSLHIEGYHYDDDVDATPATPAPEDFNDSDFSGRHSDDQSDSDSSSMHIDGYDYDDADFTPAPATLLPILDVVDDSDFSNKHSDDDTESGSVYIDGYDYDDADPVLYPAPYAIDDSDYSDRHSDEGSDSGSVHIDGFDYHDGADLILENSGYDSDCCPPTPVVDGATVHELEELSLPVATIVEAFAQKESDVEMNQRSGGFDLLDREVQVEDVNASELSVNDNSSVEGVDTPPFSPAPSADELDVPSYGQAILQNSSKQGNRVRWSPTVKSSVSPRKHKKPAPPPLDVAFATKSMEQEEVEALSGYDSDCFVDNTMQDECRITVGDAMNTAEFDDSVSNETLSSGRRKSATIQSMRDLLLGGHGSAVGVPIQEDFPVDNIDKEVVREKARLTERSRVQSRRDSDLLRSAVPVKGVPNTPCVLPEPSDHPIAHPAPIVKTASSSAQNCRSGARSRPVFDVAGAFAAYEATIGGASAGSPTPPLDALSSPTDSLCFSPASTDENMDGGGDTVLDEVVSPYSAPPVPVSLWSADNLDETSFEEEQGHVLTLEDFLPVQADNAGLDLFQSSNSNKHTTNNLLYGSPVRQLNASLREISSVERIRLHRDAYFSIDSPMEVSFTNEDVGVILDVAAGVFDSANQLNNLGFTDQSAFLYENAMRLVQLTELEDLERDLQQEITLNLL